MDQVHVIYPGCGPCVRYGIAATSSHIVYGSTLSVHIMKDKKMQVLGAHDRQITALTVHDDQLVTCALDKRIKLWSLSSQSMISQIQLSVTPQQLSIVSDAGIAILAQPGQVLWWDMNTPPSRISVGDHKIACTSIVSYASKLVIGKADGTIWLWNCDNKETVPLWSSEESNDVCILDMKFNFDGSRLLVVLSDDKLCMMNMNNDNNELEEEEEESCVIYSSPQVQITQCTWLNNDQFITINNNNHIIYKWNVNNNQKPMDVISIKNKKLQIIKAIQTIPSSNNKENNEQIMIAFDDGVVCCYDFNQDYLYNYLTNTTGSHQDTIFDIQYNPANSNVVATVSYDGTIRIWNTLTMLCMNIYKHDNNILHCVTWSSDGNNLCVSSNTGQLFIWDTKSNNIIKQINHHNKPSYRVRYHPTDVNKFCSTSSDNTAIVCDNTGKITARFTHPEAVYGVTWHPTRENVFATGCHDGIVRIWNISKSVSIPEDIFEGHKSRIFNIEWSPLLDNVLASGSDDKTIRIWYVNHPNQNKILKGHKSNIRAISWNHEIPFILLSGSWDGEIRLWDIRTCECIYMINHHFADVYGIISHPEKPFCYLTTSRDVSIRTWDISELVISKIKLQVTIDGGRFRSSALGDVKKAMHPQAPVLLCGKISKQIALENNNTDNNNNNDINPSSILLDLYRKSCMFFMASPGLYDFFELLSSNINDKKCNNNNIKQQHINDIRSTLLNECTILRNNINNSNNSDDKNILLNKLCDIYLQLGELKEYCKVLIELNLWEQALAIAPSVSLIFWKKLLEEYSKQLYNKNNSNCLPYLTSLGDHKSIISFHKQQSNLDSALNIAVAESSQRLPLIPDFGNEEDDDVKNDNDNEREDVFVTESIRTISEDKSEIYFSQGYPFYAACCHLQINDPYRAIQRLMLGGEVNVSYILSSIMKLDYVEYVSIEFSKKCESLGLWDEALIALQNNLQHSERSIALLASRCDKSGPEKADFYSKAGLPSMELYTEDAEKALKDGRKSDYAFMMIMANKYDKAINISIEELRKECNKSHWSIEYLEQLIEPLNTLILDEQQNNNTMEIIMFSYFIAGQKALMKGHVELVSYLFNTVKTISEQYNLLLPIPYAAMRMAEIHLYVNYKPQMALEMVRELANDSSQAGKLKPVVLNLKKILESNITVDTVGRYKNLNKIIPSGCYLPVNNTDNTDNDNKIISIISKEDVSNEKYVILNDGKSVISKIEYDLLSKFTSFSPLLDGSHL